MRKTKYEKDTKNQKQGWKKNLSFECNKNKSLIKISLSQTNRNEVEEMNNRTETIRMQV